MRMFSRRNRKSNVNIRYIYIDRIEPLISFHTSRRILKISNGYDAYLPVFRRTNIDIYYGANIATTHSSPLYACNAPPTTSIFA